MFVNLQKIKQPPSERPGHLIGLYFTLYIGTHQNISKNGILRKRFWACPFGPGYPFQVRAPQKGGTADFPLLSLTRRLTVKQHVRIGIVLKELNIKLK